jgi:hypothetical protein
MWDLPMFFGGLAGFTVSAVAFLLVTLCNPGMQTIGQASVGGLLLGSWAMWQARP